jgi:hypothetical protein
MIEWGERDKDLVVWHDFSLPLCTRTAHGWGYEGLKRVRTRTSQSHKKDMKERGAK